MTYKFFVVALLFILNVLIFSKPIIIEATVKTDLSLDVPLDGPFPEKIFPLYPNMKFLCESIPGGPSIGVISVPVEGEPSCTMVQEYKNTGVRLNSYLTSDLPEQILNYYSKYFQSQGWSQAQSSPKPCEFAKCYASNKLIVASCVAEETPTHVTTVMLSLVKHSEGKFTEVFGPCESNPIDKCLPQSQQDELVRQEFLHTIESQFNISLIDATQYQLGFCLFRTDELSSIKSALEILPSCTLEKFKPLLITGVTREKDIGCSNEKVFAYENDIPAVGPVGVTVCDSRWDKRGNWADKNRFYSNGDQLRRDILIHELGHRLHSNLLNPTDPFLLLWKKEIGYSKCLPLIGCRETPTEYPTEYASKGITEDIAESFRLYITQPLYLISNFPIRYNVLREQAFCGKEYIEGKD